MKKRGIKILIIIFFVIVIVFVICLVKRISSNIKKEPIKINILDTISEYGYSIDDRDSEFYKNEFTILKNILNAETIDYKAYSEQVAKMFVIDLYSIKTKVNKYDIGGLEFYHSEKQNMFEEKVKNTIYDMLEDDSYGDRKQKLPLVKEIEVLSTNDVFYKMDNKEVSAYEIILSWTYENDLGYDKEGKVIVVKDGIKESVVSYSPLKNEE